MTKNLPTLIIWGAIMTLQHELLAQAPQTKQMDFNHSMAHGGRTRTYEVHLPPSYDPSQQLPVVLNLHGGGGNATAHRRQTRMDACADKNGFIVVYPEGSSGGGRFYTWNAGSCCGFAQKWNIDDVGFIATLLDQLPNQYAIDKTRVYATGMSNGAMMAYRLGCELPNRITAICGVASTMGVNGPKPTRPIPVMQIHGLLDPNAPFEGGIGPNAILKIQHRPVREVVRWWCEVNHCGTSPATYENTPMFLHEVFTPAEGQQGEPIELYVLREGGHTWPGGVDVTPALGTGKLISDFDTDTVMWNFFKQFKLTPAATTKAAR